MDNGNHPDLAALEAVRTGEASPAEAAHARACPECQAGLGDLEGLARTFSRAPRAKVEVPAFLRAAILAQAARRPRRWVPLTGAAAILVVVAGLLLRMGGSPAYAREDIDRNGRVDILDAYALACDPRTDLTGDGVVDRRDFDHVARAAVYLARAQGERPAGAPRFAAYDVVIDTAGRPLAAYQFEIMTNAQIVGVEGGEVPFTEAPHYDPAALQGGRIIIAAFTLDDRLPAGRVRVARVHLQESGKTETSPGLMAASGPGRAAMDAKIELVRVGGNK